MLHRAIPLWRDTDAAVDEAGVSYDLRPSASHPHNVRQVKVYVGGLSFVGVGRDSSPPTPTADNTVYQESGTEEVYTIDGNAKFPLYLYVYAESTSVTHAVRVSAFG